MENKQTKRKIFDGFLHLLSCGAAGKKATDPKYSPDIWEEIFCLAVSQKLLPFVFDAVYDCDDSKKYPDIFAKYKKLSMLMIRNQTVAESDFLNCCALLEKHAINACVVKGPLCSRLYPKKSFRISGDEDLFLQEDFQKCREVLIQNGFLEKNEPREDAWETAFVSPKGRVLELHRLLFDPEDESLNALLCFDTVEKTVTDGFCTLASKDGLLYLLLHGFNHFVRGGIGIRQAWDVALWISSCGSELLDDELKQKLCKVRAFEFSKAMLEVGKKYFVPELELPKEWRFEGDVEPLVRDMLSGGVYGSSDADRLHSSTVTLAAYRSGKRKSTARAVFPPCSYMKLSYPFLHRFPFLLPFAWAKRICSYCVESVFKKKSNAKSTLRLADERLGLLEQYKIIQ